MRIVGRPVLDQFCASHADCRNWVGNWIVDVQASRWATPQDIKNRYSSASFVGRNVIFNVRGNNHRLVTVVAYRVGVVTIEWIGTHAEYDRLTS